MENWSQSDLAKLRKFVARGDTSDEIADKLHCSKGDVWTKARELGLEWRLAEVEHRKGSKVRFIVEYDDGSQDYFTIDYWTLRTGDHIAPIVARELQMDGTIMPGKIVRVYRDKPAV